MRDYRLKDCPYFIGPFAPAKVMARRAKNDRKQAARKSFVGPPKPSKRQLASGTMYGSTYEWAHDLDTSTLEGKREYGRRYYEHVERKKLGHTPREILTNEERADARRRHMRKQRKKQSAELTDRYIKRNYFRQIGVKNPPQALIELKRAQLKIHRAIKNEHS